MFHSENQKATTVEHVAQHEPGFVLRKRIGSTLYTANVYFNPTSAERLEDKIFRLIKNDLNFKPISVTIDMPQTDRLSGGSL